jgi:hypothetical protein
MASSIEGNPIETEPYGSATLARKQLTRRLVLLSVPFLLILCCVLTKFPPQIFGNNKDHFRTFVMSPIPASVEILDVEFDDLIIHPDIAYYFRFLVNRADLEKIIAYNSLERTSDECFDPSPQPSWWNLQSPSNREIYKYESDGLIISLCYDSVSQTALYAFWTY